MFVSSFIRQVKVINQIFAFSARYSFLSLNRYRKLTYLAFSYSLKAANSASFSSLSFFTELRFIIILTTSSANFSLSKFISFFTNSPTLSFFNPSTHLSRSVSAFCSIFFKLFFSLTSYANSFFKASTSCSSPLFSALISLCTFLFSSAYLSSLLKTISTIVSIYSSLPHS